jgi:hypothetical protein
LADGQKKVRAPTASEPVVMSTHEVRLAPELVAL